MSEAGLDDWRRAFALGEEQGLIPAEVAAAALEDLAGRPVAELTPALVAFLVDVPEAQLLELLRGAATAATAPLGEGAQTLGAEGELLPGAQLGDFVLGAPLGAGGMGRVYRARQLSLARDVALKVLKPALAEDLEGHRRFLREARTLAALNHPRVVTCYQVGSGDDGSPYLAMEFMPGGDVASLAKRAGGRLDEARALQVACDAAEALVAFEAAGLVHRDLKPQNLFLDEDGRAKLGDLGLARSSAGSDRMTLTGMAVGTLPYMSPEQLEGAPDVDVRADLYALGATLYTLLAGRPPRINQGPPRLPDASPRTAAFVRRAMAPERARRYPSAEAALAALREAQAALAGPSSAAPSATRAARAPAAPGSRPGLWALGLAGVVAASLVAVGPGRAWLGGSAAAEPGTQAPRDPAPTAEPREPAPREEPGALAPREEPVAEAPTPPAAPARDEPVPSAAPAGPLAGLPISPRGRSLREATPGHYASQPNPGVAWDRAAVFDVERRPLPLRVRWTAQATASRDAPSLADWERGHGFAEPAGFFFELGLRAENAQIEAANELGAAWWVTLSVRASGRVLGIVRQVTHARPPGTDLIALPQPGLPRVPGVDLVERFAFDAEPGAALEVDLDADVEGWSLRVSHAGVELAALPQRPWSASPRAPLTTEFDEGVYLWSHLGNFSGGAGRGSVEVSLR